MKSQNYSPAMGKGCRGSKKIFSDLFETPFQKHKKGRSKKLYILRNECLLDRYIYYGHLSGKRYDLILKILSNDFFLSESTIADLLNCNYEKLSSLKKSYQALSQIAIKKKLKSKWPHLSWEVTLNNIA
ncbi:MAG: hypothetical protein ABIN97_20910 [Ginsengibacter sp.]